MPCKARVSPAAPQHPPPNHLSAPREIGEERRQVVAEARDIVQGGTPGLVVPLDGPIHLRPPRTSSARPAGPRGSRVGQRGVHALARHRMDGVGGVPDQREPGNYPARSANRHAGITWMSAQARIGPATERERGPLRQQALDPAAARPARPNERKPPAGSCDVEAGPATGHRKQQAQPARVRCTDTSEPRSRHVRRSNPTSRERSDAARPRCPLRSDSGRMTVRAHRQAGLDAPRPPRCGETHASNSAGRVAEQLVDTAAAGGPRASRAPPREFRECRRSSGRDSG